MNILLIEALLAIIYFPLIIFSSLFQFLYININIILNIFLDEELSTIIYFLLSCYMYF